MIGTAEWDHRGRMSTDLPSCAAKGPLGETGDRRRKRVTYAREKEDQVELSHVRIPGDVLRHDACTRAHSVRGRRRDGGEVA